MDLGSSSLGLVAGALCVWLDGTALCGDVSQGRALAFEGEQQRLRPIDEVMTPSDEAAADALAHYGWGFLLGLDESPDADTIADEYLSALAADPDSESALRDLLSLWAEHGRDAEDTAVLEHLAPLSAQYPTALSLNLVVANVHLRRGDFAAAGALLDRLSRHHGWQSPRLLKEQILFCLRSRQARRGHWLLAQAMQQPALNAEFLPHQVAALFYDDIAYDSTYHWPVRTRDRYQRLAYLHALRAAALADGDADPDAVAALARLLIRAGLPDDALGPLERLWQAEQATLGTERLRALCYESRGAWATAAEIWRWLVDQQPFEAEFHRGLGRVAAKRRQYRRAADAYENAYRLSLSPALAAEVARLSLLAQRPQQALEYAQLAPPSPRLCLIMAHAHRARNEYSQALEAMLAAHRLAGADDAGRVLNGPYYTLLAVIYRQLGRFDEAIGALHQALKRDPDGEEARLLLVLVNEEAGRDQQAMQWLDQLLDKHPDSAALHQHAGRLHRARGEALLAVAEFQRAYDLAPSPKAARELALGLLDAEYPQDALQLLKTTPVGLSRALLEAHCWRRLKNDDAALETLHAAAARVEHDPRRLGIGYYLLLASIYEARNAATETIDSLEAAATLAPDDPEVANFLGYFLADRGEQLRRAESLIRKAVAAEPENAAYLDSLAWVYYRQRRFQDAATAIRKALTVQGDIADPVILDHAGDIYRALGQQAAAAAHWRAAIERGIDDAAGVQSKLEQLAPSEVIGP